MNTSTIKIEVSTDEKRIQDTIKWSATDQKEDALRVKAIMLALWDGAEKTAMRIDLWTKDMMVDEMADFFYQTLMTMADTYGRATHFHEQVDDMKSFAREF